MGGGIWTEGPGSPGPDGSVGSAGVALGPPGAVGDGDAAGADWPCPGETVCGDVEIEGTTTFGEPEAAGADGWTAVGQPLEIRIPATSAPITASRPSTNGPVRRRFELVSLTRARV